MTMKTYRCKVCKRKMDVPDDKFHWFKHEDKCMVRKLSNAKDLPDYFQRIYKSPTIIIRGVK